MANRRWTGNALPVADVWTLTPGGTIEVGDLFITTINGKDFSYAATSATLATVTAGLTAALNGLDSNLYPEFAEYTFADTGTAVTATADEEGVPGTITVSTTEAGGGAADAQTYVATHTTTGTGPNNWDNVDNWAEGIVPVAADDVYIEDSAVDILYGIDQNTVTLTSLTVAASFTGKIGLPRRNANGYQEYRETYLKISATTVNIGQGSGNGSGRIKLNTGSVATTVNVFGTGTAIERGIESFLWVGTSASNAMNAVQGSIGVAIFATETANLSGGLKIGYESNASRDVQIRCGSGVTLATVTQTGSECELNSNATTINRTGGTMTHRGTATVTTLNNYAGDYIDESSGTMTTLNNFATYNRRRVVSAKTITTAKLYKGSKTWTPAGPVTYTNAVEFHGCAPGDSGGTEWDVGIHKKYTYADI